MLTFNGKLWFLQMPGFTLKKRSLVMIDDDRNILTLKEALQQPCKYRDMDLALQPMDNHSKTPGGPNQTPLSFWASWNLNDRPRRVALLFDDCQEEYRPYAGDILPNLVRVLDAFRTA